jgi:hypothetical protein
VFALREFQRRRRERGERKEVMEERRESEDGRILRRIERRL